MENEKVVQILTAKGVRPTPNRILVVRELMNENHPISLSDLELSLSPMDKGSIFRVLELLAKNDIVHSIEDGSRSVKYELCGNPANHSVEDQHVHFYCVSCDRTICLEDIRIPLIEMPAGFRMSSVNYVVKGICADCASRKR